LESGDQRPDLQPLHPESAVARFRQCKAIGALTVEGADAEPQTLLLLQDYLGIGDHQLASRFITQLTSGLYRGFSAQLNSDGDNAPRFGKAREQIAAFYKLAVGGKQVSADFACVQVSPVLTISK
jgi:hypothetical protein